MSELVSNFAVFKYITTSYDTFDKEYFEQIQSFSPKISVANDKKLKKNITGQALGFWIKISFQHNARSTVISYSMKSKHLKGNWMQKN